MTAPAMRFRLLLLRVMRRAADRSNAVVRGISAAHDPSRMLNPDSDSFTCKSTALPRRSPGNSSGATSHPDRSRPTLRSDMRLLRRCRPGTYLPYVGCSERPGGTRLLPRAFRCIDPPRSVCRGSPAYPHPCGTQEGNATKTGPMSFMAGVLNKRMDLVKRANMGIDFSTAGGVMKCTLGPITGRTAGLVRPTWLARKLLRLVRSVPRGLE